MPRTLTAVAHCHGCPWTTTGDPDATDKAAARHVAETGHAVGVANPGVQDDGDEPGWVVLITGLPGGRPHLGSATLLTREQAEYETRVWQKAGKRAVIAAVVPEVTA